MTTSCYSFHYENIKPYTAYASSKNDDITFYINSVSEERAQDRLKQLMLAPWSSALKNHCFDTFEAYLSHILGAVPPSGYYYELYNTLLGVEHLWRLTVSTDVTKKDWCTDDILVVRQQSQS